MNNKPATLSNRRNTIAFYLSISPWLIGFLLFALLPMGISLAVSFTNWDLIGSPGWVGMANYQRLLNDPTFLKSIKVTFTYTFLYVPLDLLGGLMLALLVRPKLPGIGVFRSIYYLPVIFSGVTFVVVWMWMLNPDGGLVNLALAAFGVQGPRWLMYPNWALPALILMSFWGWGRSMVLFLGALQAIPQEIYEAAQMDGAGKMRQFFRITLPLITPMLFFNLVLSIIATFQTFTSAFVATNGGPLDATLFLVLYIYRQAFEYFNMGYASALAWVLLLIVLVFTLLVVRSQRFWVFYLGDEVNG